jgi:glycogen operon protein
MMPTAPATAVPDAVLGPHLADGRATFAVDSSTATAIEVCLLAAGGERRVSLDRDDDGIWRGEAARVAPGQRYALRAHGPRRPAEGLLFDPSRLLLDPYARAAEGIHGLLVEDGFDWQGDRPLRTPLERTVILEAHVRGFTRLHPGVPPALRGTYAGLAQPTVIEELHALGVTAIELLPVQHFVSEPAVVARGLVNYWGYSPLGFHAPHAPYAASGAAGSAAEFRRMVRTLHAAGIEVLVDVVYNHTAEGGPGAPSLSYRGLDNPAYYRLDPTDRSRYVDFTGCGNTLDARSPVVQRLVLDSLRYFVRELHVDGFRFDLASALGRVDGDFDPHAELLRRIAKDPVLRRVKLIAEPWDAALGGYALGRFPAPFAEWNGAYRDAVREFWRGHSPSSDLARALAGSSDIFAPSRRRPLASVNFVTSHDGFTLRDLVSYDDKRNDANGEQNRDGDDHNRSWNSGAEGETDDDAVVALRQRRAGAMLATLLLSAGVPMLVAGDERGRTQRGNNNAYCQDNPLSWLDWTLDAPRAALLHLVRRLVALRAAEPVFRRTRFLRGASDDGATADVRWLASDGHEMDAHWWQPAEVHTLGVLLAGDGADEPGATMLSIFNADEHDVPFALPERFVPAGAEIVLDTANPERPAEHVSGEVVCAAWSVLVLRLHLR